MADPTTVYSLALLAEYTHSLDSLPLDLSRNFADLRELDAVLSSSMSLITAKINQLTEMIEDRGASPEDRLWLLTEIGDEANRLKLGGEDKIRVASAAADNLRNHKNHLIDLLHYLPNFDPSVLNRTTYYPHVTSKSYPPHSVETGRRQRRGGNLTGIRNNDGNGYFVNEPNPPKKKRGAGREDEAEVGLNRTPRKDRIVDMSNGRPRNAGRGGIGGRRCVTLQLFFFFFFFLCFTSTVTQTRDSYQRRVPDRIARLCRFTRTTQSIVQTASGRPPQRHIPPCKRYQTLEAHHRSTRPNRSI